MNIKRAPGGLGATIKPQFHYTNGEKISNPYILQRERKTLAMAFAYGLGKPLRYELTDQRHRAIYFHLEMFLHNYPPYQFSVKYFTEYLTHTGALEICGGASYVRGIFQGIGEAA